MKKRLLGLAIAAALSLIIGHAFASGGSGGSSSGGSSVSITAGSADVVVSPSPCTSGSCTVDLGNTPSITGALTTTQSIAATSTDGIIAVNPTAATVGAQKWSPRIRFEGNGWKTTATAGSQVVDAIIELQPVQGTASPTANLVISSSINGGGYGALLTMPSGGGLNLNSGTYQINGTQIQMTDLSNGANNQIGGFGFNISNGGSVITTGIKGSIVVPYACTITDVWLLGDQSGSIVIDVWKKAFTTTLPAVGQTITASALPTLSSAITFHDGTLTGWTKTVAKGDMLTFNVNSVSTLLSASITFGCTRT